MNKFIVFVCLPLLVNARLCWRKEIQCGNICVRKGHVCQCGDEKITAFPNNKQCCSNSPCDKTLLQGSCLQGKVIPRREKCNGICTQRLGWGFLSCPNTTTCREKYQQIHMCHGLRLGVCNGSAAIEENICKNADFQCESLLSWQACGNITGAKYIQNECYSGKDSRFFSCVNRIDQAKVIFELPLFKKQDKYDILKNTNETGLNCGNVIFPWNVSHYYGLDDQQIDHLKSDEQCKKHIGMIKRDFSFKYKEKVNWNLKSWGSFIHTSSVFIPFNFYQNQCDFGNALKCTNNTNICYSKN